MRPLQPRPAMLSRSIGRAGKGRSRGNCGRRQVWPACGSGKIDRTVHEKSSHQYAIGSRRDSKQRICSRQRRWSTHSRDLTPGLRADTADRYREHLSDRNSYRG
jgi:hypothetical protein